MYQKCPICNGTGLQESIGSRDKLHPLEPCRICNGTAIIDEITGLPPMRQYPMVPKEPSNFQKIVDAVSKDNPDWKPIMEEIITLPTDYLQKITYVEPEPVHRPSEHIICERTIWPTISPEPFNFNGGNPHGNKTCDDINPERYKTFDEYKSEDGLTLRNR